MIAFLKVLPFFTTMLGGLVALRAGRLLHLVYGVAAGAMLGLVAFHLLPEFGKFAGVAPGGVPLPYVLIVVAFLAMFVLEELVGPHPSDADEGSEHRHPHVGLIGAGALVLHSFLDGLAIGIGFTVSDAIGIAILIAVLAHDFADGMTTAAIMRRHGNTPGRTWALVTAGAVAPVIGAFVGGWLNLSESWVIGYAGFFAGTLIYFATRDMIPGARQGGTARVTFATIAAGALLMWLLAAAGI
ncbi:MAG: ZIP family metal transporter [Thermoleophilia bacterium]|jgi:ZIP family zinc transporter